MADRTNQVNALSRLSSLDRGPQLPYTPIGIRLCGFAYPDKIEPVIIMVSAPTERLHSSGRDAPLIGRDEEISQLESIFREVSEQREARIVTVVGTGGIGKQRLLEELILRLRDPASPGARIFRASARSQGLSYGIFSRLLRSRFGIVEGTPAEEASRQLREQVARVLEDRKIGDVCFFLAQLMALPFQDSPLTRAVSDDPAQARLVRRAVLRSFFDKDATTGLRPMCLVLEEVHFADDDALDLLEYLVDHLTGPILVLCAGRPELLSRRPRWTSLGQDRHTVMEIGPIAPEDARALARQLLAPCEGGPPDALVERCVNMAGGNPGLLAGMVRILHDAGVLRERSPLATRPVWRVDMEKLASVRVPLTVEDAVAARISGLSSTDRRVLEHAAAMGSVFWLGGLVTLARMDRQAPEYWSEGESTDTEGIAAIVEELVRRDYVLKLPESAFAGDVEYVFKHNLERAKLAELTSSVARRGNHQTIADWLAQKEHVRAEEEYSAMLARHLEQAGSLTRAGLTYLQAGDIARRHYAAKKAHEYYRTGLGLLGADDARRRVDALHDYGDVLLILGKTDEALAAFRQMKEIAYRFNLKGKGGAAHNRIGRLFRDTGSLELARRHLDTGLDLFRDAADERGIATSQDDIGTLLWVQGHYDDALKHLKEALELRKKLGDRRSIALSLNNIGLVWMDSGREARAADALEAALSIRREIGDPIGVIQTLNSLGRLAQDQKEYERALQLFQEAHVMARDIGEHNRIAAVLINIGVAHHRLNHPDDAIRYLKEAEVLCDELGDRLRLAEAKRGLAKAYLSRGDLVLARQRIKQAIDLFGHVRSKSHLAGALRTLGKVTAAGAWGEAHEPKAVEYFMRSIALCKEIGNELELAKSYRAFSNVVTSSPHYVHDRNIQREARKLNEMAEEIFERHRAAAQSEATSELT